jgi:hypothetical protein
MPNAVFFEIEREDRQGAVAQQQSSSTRSTDRRYSLKVLETRRDRKIVYFHLPLKRMLPNISGRAACAVQPISASHAPALPCGSQPCAARQAVSPGLTFASIVLSSPYLGSQSANHRRDQRKFNRLP